MISHEIREKLQNIVHGTRFEGPADNCATVRNLLVESFGTGSTVKSEFESRAIIKEKQASFLKAWAQETGIWLDGLPVEDEYLNSLLLHNLLFPNTAYLLIGFIEIEDGLSVVLQQPFINGEQARLDDIREFLSYNGFENTKRQDYYNEEFGLVLEDMHDENVIAKDDLLFFIDTVFYVMKKK